MMHVYLDLTGLLLIGKAKDFYSSSILTGKCSGTGKMLSKG